MDPLLLDVHPRDADDVVLAKGLPVDFLDVFVKQIYVVVTAEPRDRGKRTRNHCAPLVARIERKGILYTRTLKLSFSLLALVEDAGGGKVRAFAAAFGWRLLRAARMLLIAR